MLPDAPPPRRDIQSAGPAGEEWHRSVRGPVPPLLVFLAAGAFLGARISPLREAAGQFSKYPLAAVQLLHGAIEKERLLDFSPAYLALHTRAYAHAADPFVAVQWVQVASSAIAAALIFATLRHFFGGTLALAGAAAFTLCRSLAVYTYIFEPEALLVASITGGLYLATRRGLAARIGAGAALGVALLTRPVVLPLALLLALWFLVQPGAGRHQRISAVLFLIPVAAAVAFLSLRGHRLSGSFAPMAMNPGTVFYDGNNPRSTGLGAAYPEIVDALGRTADGESDFQHAAYRLVARRETGKPLGAGGVNRLYARRAAAFVADHPRHALGRLTRKVVAVFHGDVWHDLRSAYAADRFLRERGAAVPWPLLSALALAGLALGLRRWRDYLPFYAAFAVQAVFMVVTYASARQRLALLPAVVFFAAAAVDAARRSRRDAAGCALAVAALVWPLSRETPVMRDNRHVWTSAAEMSRHLDRAREMREAFDFTGARGEVEAAWAAAPWAAGDLRVAGVPGSDRELAAGALRLLPPPAAGASERLDRAILLVQAGQAAAASELLRELSREAPDFVRLPGRVGEASYHLARLAQREGRGEEAQRLLREALQGSPGDSDILAELVALTGEEQYRAALVRYHGETEALLATGRAFLAWDRGADAAASFRRLTSLVPEYCQGWALFAAALGLQGSYTEAVQAYGRAEAECSDPVLAGERIEEAFSGYARTHPEEGVAWFRLGLVQRRLGRYAEARASISRAWDLAHHPNAAAELKRLDDLLRLARLP